MSIKTQTLFPIPFAQNAGDSGRFDITATNETEYPQKATYEEGFPPVTRISTQAGGKNPFGQDFNGIFYQVTSAIRELQAGKTLTYNEDFANEIGGYTVGAKVTGSDGLIYICTVDGNTSDPTGLDGWQTFFNSNINSTSITQAATPSAVKSAYDLARNAMPKGTGGIGLATQTATNSIDIDTYAFNVGFYSGNNWSSTKGLPFGRTATDIWFYLINQNLASAGSNYKLQILGLNGTGTPRLAMRYKVKGSWTDWAEFISNKNITDYPGIGYNQTWQDVTSSRSLGVTYTNATDKPIAMFVSVSNNAYKTSMTNLVVTVNSVVFDMSSGRNFGDGDQGAASGEVIIPIGGSYIVTSANSAITNWNELR